MNRKEVEGIGAVRRSPEAPAITQRANKNLYLLGFMGCGKSQLGAMLGQTLRWPFVDIDALIEAEQGMSIAQIFQRFGEMHFRALELRALEELSQSPGHVVALGGGTAARPQAWPYLRTSGLSIYIKRSAQQLYVQLQGSTDRPMLKKAPPSDPLGFIKSLLAQREPFYLQADIIFECKDGWSREETIVHLLNILEGKL